MNWPWLRIGSATTWVVAFVVWLSTAGFTTERFTVVFWVITALVAFTLGSRPWWQAPLDWMPIIVFFLAYDWTRGHAAALGRPVMWLWPPKIDAWIGGGTVPSVWLQERFAASNAHVPWWEAPVATVYLSHFIAPFVIGGVLWVRRRDQFIRFMTRLALVSAIGVVGYTLVPAAPPWAAARCTHAEVADNPRAPACLSDPVPEQPDRTVLPALERHEPGYRPLVQRISSRGWAKVPGMERTRGFIQTGIDSSNLVAAVPSLHGAGALLVSWFLWPLARRRWRPLLAAYPFAMAFSLVYGGDHYIVDIVLGWALVAFVMLTVGRFERFRAVRTTDATDATDAPDASAPAEVAVPDPQPRTPRHATTH